ncbi:MAG: glycerol-3-phosphate acyltransferase [Candidatus Paceibacterota bacterium]|jgi:glycerol-3-phosphate acyltransferase PlsY
MDIFISCLLIALVSYVLGSIPGAVVVGGLFTKKNFEKEESGNLGATNALRIVSKEKGKFLGAAAFSLVFIFDASKAVAACFIAQTLIPDNIAAVTLATFFTVVGHNYSIFLKFHGGRGAASLIGILIYLDYKMFLVWFGTFLLSAIVFEIVESKKIDKKLVVRAIDKQIIGRLAGEVLALVPIYFLDKIVFWPTLAVTPLILIRHKERVLKQIEERDNQRLNN